MKKIWAHVEDNYTLLYLAKCYGNVIVDIKNEQLVYTHKANKTICPHKTIIQFIGDNTHKSNF